MRSYHNIGNSYMPYGLSGSHNYSKNDRENYRENKYNLMNKLKTPVIVGIVGGVASQAMGLSDSAFKTALLLGGLHYMATNLYKK